MLFHYRCKIVSLYKLIVKTGMVKYIMSRFVCIKLHNCACIDRKRVLVLDWIGLDKVYWIALDWIKWIGLDRDWIGLVD